MDGDAQQKKYQFFWRVWKELVDIKAAKKVAATVATFLKEDADILAQK